MGKTISEGGISHLFYRTCHGISGALLPRRCVVCDGGVHAQTASLLNRYVCPNCLTLVEQAQGVRCQRCGLALGPRLQDFGWTHCRHCKPLLEQTGTPPRKCVVCCDYIPPFDQWITQLKYGKAHGLAAFLGQWLALNVKTSGVALPDLLIPVPCSRDKLQRRGYNQAALIANSLGRRIRRPVCTDVLVKTGEVATQAELGRSDRLKNLQGAFIARRPVHEGLKIGLVDDVITTGATLESCELALRKAGAKSILIMAVCRTPE